MSFKISSKSDYHEQYLHSLNDPDAFWEEKAQNFRWFKKWQKVSDCDFSKAKNEWFKGGKTNIAYNCLDRHLKEENVDERMKKKVAIIFEPNEINDKTRYITYEELYKNVCQFANLLLANDVKAGDRVAIYMPMIPEAAIAMLACARIGAIHSVVFAGFSSQSLAGRIQDSQAKMLITAELLYRGDKVIKPFEMAKEALKECDSIKNVILYQKQGQSVVGKLFSSPFVASKDDLYKVLIWQEEIVKHTTNAPYFEAESNDPLFILYTSGSTGKPKGIVHGHGGYMVYSAYSFKNIFQYHFADIFFCTADIGWITGHSYLVYAPLLNGATIVMYEGVPTYPTAARLWQIIAKHKVTIFYTAPTAIRALMQKGDEFVAGQNLQSLKTLGSVGEPINQEAWQWYYDKVGLKKCNIVDSWWQTETGGIMIASLAGLTPSIPTYAGLPFCGVEPILFDDQGKEIKEANKIGNLCFKKAWPGLALGVWGGGEKFYNTYFATFKNCYFSGDGAFRNEEGLYRIIGRVDDVLNVSGHRIGTAEIENVINLHQNVAESAVIGYNHEIKGQGICAFVIAKKGCFANKDLENEILELIKKEIGSIAKPDRMYIVEDLPKTRSGKIMRRILKKILNKESDLGDVSTLLNPEIVEKVQEMVKI